MTGGTLHGNCRELQSQSKVTFNRIAEEVISISVTFARSGIDLEVIWDHEKRIEILGDPGDVMRGEGIRESSHFQHPAPFKTVF